MDSQLRARRTTAVFWMLAGAMHFVSPSFYEAIVPPPFRSFKRQVVQLSGIAELLGGAAVMPARTRGFARSWLLVTLIAIFPANIYMALAPERFKRFPKPALWARLPLQALIGWMTWRGTA